MTETAQQRRHYLESILAQLNSCYLIRNKGKAIAVVLCLQPVILPRQQIGMPNETHGNYCIQNY
jgi:hypothetical protein